MVTQCSQVERQACGVKSQEERDMGIFSSVYRYFITLGGLIGGDIDKQTDEMLSSPGGIKATYAKARTDWKTQYHEVRSAVAQLLKVLEDKRQQVDMLRKEATTVKTKMKGAVEQYKRTNDELYKKAFSDLHTREAEITARQGQLDTEIADLQAKVEAYKKKLKEMDGRIQELDQQEAKAIADIVSSKQIINLNDRLNNLSVELDDENLRSIEERRKQLLAESKLSGELSEVDGGASLEEELLAAGRTNEADDLFAAMLAEDEKRGTTSESQATEERKREL